jgi:tRNA nucleotidyltransferase (CCA-adding enzyme)
MQKIGIITFMEIQLPIEVLFILKTLQQNNFEAYLVGGAVRDIFLNQFHKETGEHEIKQLDYDFTTNATPEQVQAIFPESYYENAFGTVGIAPKHLHQMMGTTAEQISNAAASEQLRSRIIDIANASKIHISLQQSSSTENKNVGTPLHLQDYEITTYRSDGVYNDHRRPESVTWGKSIHEDLSRRDFTINALALTIPQQKIDQTIENWLATGKTAFASFSLQASDYKVIDEFEGLKDLRDHSIRTVGEPHLRFSEDALRMLRAIRLSVQLNMKMTDETFIAVTALAENIQHISWERIGEEIMKMIASPYPAEAIELLEETGLLHYLIPELREGKNIEQGGHHTTDVWTHSLDALRTTPATDPIVRLATLLHDVAKPRTYHQEDNSKPTFYNHEVIGARVARAIALRLRLSKHDADRIFTLVRHHMFYYQPTHTDAAVRRFMRKVGLENIDDILDLREGDRLGSGARKTSWRLEEMKQRMIEQLHQPFAITDLAIDGNDLMSELGLKPGPLIGKILKELFERVLDQPELNIKEILLKEAQQLAAQIESPAQTES